MTSFEEITHRISNKVQHESLKEQVFILYSIVILILTFLSKNRILSDDELNLIIDSNKWK